MDFEKYENDRPCPEKPCRKCDCGARVPIGWNFCGGCGADIKTPYEAALKTYQENLNTYRIHKANLLEAFKKDALEESGLIGHPKADKAYEMAWDTGHSSGLACVFDDLCKLTELLL